MTQSLSIALAQANPTVGDVSGNLEKIRTHLREAARQGADILLLPELFTVGYPPEDLVLKPSLQAAARAAVEALAAEHGEGAPALLVPTPWVEDDRLYNAVAVIEGGRIVAVPKKVDLPNYGVFDEKRVFAAGPAPEPVELRGARIGIPICEDVWSPEPCAQLREKGAELLLVPNGSPYAITKYDERLIHARARVAETGLSLVYLNQIGGQDELAFDGGSFILTADGQVTHQFPSWTEHFALTRWHKQTATWAPEPGAKAETETGLEAVYKAMMLGLGDYVRKNRFPGVVLGLSGGIDSALTAAVAADALGPENVHCVMMPSRYTSSESVEDAKACAKLLGVPYRTIPIVPAVGAFGEMLGPVFEGRDADVTEENIQSRIRGVLLMALSNKFGHMLLSTGNKSEMSVGYATLYGDMNGGYNALKDVYKTQVFDLCRWRNQHHPDGGLAPAGRVIPERIIEKPPSAELREDQKDEDSLPPYEVLDDILSCLVEGEMRTKEIVARGHDPEIVGRIEHLLYISEYKRRQAPPGVKITVRNFGRDRRYPITNGFRDKR